MSGGDGEIGPPKSTKNHHPNFTLFLGAGASISSGIKSAWGMIEEWRANYIDMYDIETLESQPWYNKTAEYSELFEALYDQPTQRREYIENCIIDAKPSWGYVYLANLLQKKHFNTIFTTNFDDLINESCYAFSNKLRPVVCAHDSSIKNIRLTSNRPKIIKLHGDFLFDNIKNTVRELESLEDNMRSKFRQYASEFGMIVIGYAGNDRSIMDTLNTLLHSGTAFPHGIYWCIRKDSEPSDDVKNLARFPRFHLVEIDSFDDFVAELHQELGCELQDEVANPYSALAAKLDDTFMISEDECEQERSYVIQKDLSLLKEHIKMLHSATDIVAKLDGLIAERQSKTSNSDELTTALQELIDDMQLIKYESSYKLYAFPKIMLADIAFEEDDFEKAIKLCEEALQRSYNIHAVILMLRAAIASENNRVINRAISQLKDNRDLSPADSRKLISIVVDLIDEKKYDLAQEILNILEESNLSEENKRFTYLNKALILKLNNQSLDDLFTSQLLSMLEKSMQEEKWWLSLGLSILVDNFTLTCKLSKNLSKEQRSDLLLKKMPIFQLIPVETHIKIISDAFTDKYDFSELKNYDDPHSILPEIESILEEINKQSQEVNPDRPNHNKQKKY